MTDSHEQSYFLERFELVKDMLHEGDVDSAVESLVDLREKGFINKELDEHIDLLRGDPGDEQLQETIAWVERVIASILSYGGDVFAMVEELSEAAIGVSEAEWVEFKSENEDQEQPDEDESDSVKEDAQLQDVEELAEFDDLDEFSDLEDFSEFDDLDELSDLDEFADLDGLDEVSSSDEGDQLDDESSVDVEGEDDEEWADEATEALSSPVSSSASVADADESSEEASEELEESSVPSIDFAMLDESPSQVVRNLSNEELEEAAREFADESELSDAAEELSEESEDVDTEEADEDSQAHELSEASEQPSDEGDDDSEAYELSEVSDSSDDDAGELDVDLGLDDMDFDFDSEPDADSDAVEAGESESYEEDPDVSGASQEILLEDEVEDADSDSLEGESDLSMEDRATRKHQVPDVDPAEEAEPQEGFVSNEDGNATKVAGLNEPTSNRAPQVEQAEHSEDDVDAEFRETRKHQSVDAETAAGGRAESSSETSDDDGGTLGAADDGFQLFSDSEAEEMGLDYSSDASSSEADEESVDPFDDDEDLDPFEDELVENPFADDELFGDESDASSDADAQDEESERMPDTSSGEVRYRGAAPDVSHTESAAGSGELRFDEPSDSFAEDASSETSKGQFSREKTQRNESLAELASSMRSDDELDSGPDLSKPGDPEDESGSARSDSKLSPGAISESDADDDFDLGLSNPEERAMAPSSAADEGDDDFDLGLSNPADRVESPSSVAEDADDGAEEGEVSETFFGGPASLQDESEQEDEEPPSRHRPPDTSGSKPRIRFDSNSTPAPDAPKRELEPTPAGMAAVSTSEESVDPSDSLDEDEFFDLAESLAQESSQIEETRRPKYRGEPLVGESDVEDAEVTREGGEDDENPFAHEAPTGVQSALRESESSFVLEEIPDEDAEERAAVDVLLEEAERLVEKGRYESALDLTESILERDPDLQEAETLKSTIEEELEEDFSRKIGSLQQVPTLEVEMSEIATLDLDSRAGFLLSQMDGTSTLADLCELSNMSKTETLAVVADLLDRDVISLE